MLRNTLAMPADISLAAFPKPVPVDTATSVEEAYLTGSRIIYLVRQQLVYTPKLAQGTGKPVKAIPTQDTRIAHERWGQLREKRKTARKKHAFVIFQDISSQQRRGIDNYRGAA